MTSGKGLGRDKRMFETRASRDLQNHEYRDLISRDHCASETDVSLLAASWYCAVLCTTSKQFGRHRLLNDDLYGPPTAVDVTDIELA